MNQPTRNTASKEKIMFSTSFSAGRRLVACAVALGAALAAVTAQAEDIDLFVANPLQTSAAAPNIMFMVDNSSNWSREAQHWPDNGGNQGTAELAALQNILATPLNANVGLAMYTKVGNNLGGYIRYGIRDVGDSTAGGVNRTALNNIIGLVKANINDPKEKVNDSSGEAAALYEIYKYYKSLPAFRGGYSSGDTPYVDFGASGNTTERTAYGQGLRSDFAIASGSYVGPSTATCGRSYVIFIVNNAQGSIPEGSQTYESASAGNSLPLIPGVSDVSWTDEWARFLYNNGISVYILDAYNAQQNKSHSAVLQRAARVAGGEYFAVKNQTEIELAIKKILAEIRAVNTTFAAASLPISATNRSQNLNQVFIGMFRPDADAEPRWMGNLKQYQLGRTVTGIDLVDRLGQNAVNAQTGFLRECAASLWTTGSGNYWEAVYANALARSGCTVFPSLDGVTGSEWSDFPDGPTVEKGGVAEVLRKGNNPPTTDSTPTWASNRSVLTYTTSTTSNLTTLTTSITGWSSTLFDWVLGYDDTSTGSSSEFIDTSTTPRTRPSIHGDVIHSRPLPVNYGASGVTVYYGANDGMLRAVDASTGKERWAYVAPEHYSQYARLHDNRPLVKYPNIDPELNPLAKDYFFDGSVGLYQNADNSRIWIFPSMRRGGRMLYGFDVTDPASPRIKWRIGCPNQGDNVGCTTGMEGIGQTWSLPSVAFLKGHSADTPMVVVGGGYDTCEDVDSATVSCSTRKGNSIYVINADTGAIVKTFTPSGAGSFAADVAMSDVNGDGSVDFGYAVDTIGNVYRIDFADSAYVPQAAGSWGIRKVAFTSGAGRKFLYPPSLLRVRTKMYVALGSGNRERPLVTNYPYTDPIQNRFYVLLDDLTIPPSSTVAAVDMDGSGMQDFSSPTGCDEAGVTPMSTSKGWFMNLPYRGEQVVTSALIAAGMVAFNTNRPVATTANSCSAPLGEARGYWVNLANGSGAIGVGNNRCGGDRSSVFAGGGLTPSPTLATVVVDGRTTTVVIGAANREGGQSVTIDPQEVKPTINSRRRTIYWKSNAAD
ncbi:MAG: pilus assembly protein [Ramlibacter sp.]